MSIRQIQAIAPQPLTATAATYYTVPDLVTSVIRAFTVCNPTAAAIALTVNIAQGAAADSNQVVRQAIPANTTTSIAGLIGQALTNGDQLIAQGEGLVTMMTVAEIV